MNPYTIRIFLPDGRPSGIQLAEIIGWTGKALVAQRSDLKNLAGRSEIHQMGIYFLIGKSADDFEQDMVYVGEGKVWERLTRHDNNKDFWTRVVCFVSKDQNLTKGHVQYLEGRLIHKIRDAGRVLLENTQKTQSDAGMDALPESDKADMNSFLRHIEMMLPVLGCNFLKPKPQMSATNGGITNSNVTKPDVPVIENVESPLFEIRRSGTRAFAKEINGEFVVLKDSTTRKLASRWWRCGVAIQKRLLEEKRLVDSENPQYYRFTEDVVFSSPSAAAGVVLACEVNGRIQWRITGTKQTYGEWQSEQTTMAEQDTEEDSVIEMPAYQEEI